jgi:hypothetical protein
LVAGKRGPTAHHYLISPNDSESEASRPSSSLFPLGRVVATPGALAELSHDEIQAALQRHHSGDWGDLDKDDWAENEKSLLDGLRLLSVYRSAAGVKFYIITEWNRSVTTVLLPEEY